jgi:hypothetical protein
LEFRIGDRDAQAPGHGTVWVGHVLSEHRLMLIRGEADGGKITLLRWLVVMAARSGFSGNWPRSTGMCHSWSSSRAMPDSACPGLKSSLTMWTGHVT